MRTRLTAGIVTLTLATAACGGDGGTGPSSFESLAGAYAGSLVGLTQGVALDATFAISLSQSQGSISGTWSLTGTLTDGVDVLDIAGAGTVTGTVAAGTNPSINVTFRTPVCPGYQAHFSGVYDGANQKLTISGPVDVLAPNCTVALSYAATIILFR